MSSALKSSQNFLHVLQPFQDLVDLGSSALKRAGQQEVKKKNGYTKEIVAVCKACVTASEGQSSGSGKKKYIFAAQLLHVYRLIICTLQACDDIAKPPERTGEAVIQRLRLTCFQCLKFQGTLSSITAKSQTGSPMEQDVERAALSICNYEAMM